MFGFYYYFHTDYSSKSIPENNLISKCHFGYSLKNRSGTSFFAYLLGLYQA